MVQQYYTYITISRATHGSTCPFISHSTRKETSFSNGQTLTNYHKLDLCSIDLNLENNKLTKFMW